MTEEILHVRLTSDDMKNIAQTGTKEQIEARFAALGFDPSRRLWHSVDPENGDIYYHGRKLPTASQQSAAPDRLQSASLPFGGG